MDIVSRGDSMVGGGGGGDGVSDWMWCSGGGGGTNEGENRPGDAPVDSHGASGIWLAVVPVPAFSGVCGGGGDGGDMDIIEEGEGGGDDEGGKTCGGGGGGERQSVSRLSLAGILSTTAENSLVIVSVIEGILPSSGGTAVSGLEFFCAFGPFKSSRPLLFLLISAHCARSNASNSSTLPPPILLLPRTLL